MRERLAQCGGSFTAGPTPENGWQIVGKIPHRITAPLTLGDES
jgi:signal transduction histidine kinase